MKAPPRAEAMTNWSAVYPQGLEKVLTCQKGPGLGGPIRFLEEIIFRVRHEGA